MPALPPYIPAKDADFAAWLANFSTLLTATPYAYAQTPSSAAAVAAVAAPFAAAYALAINPPTRSPVTVQAKNVARINAQVVVRPIAQEISVSQGVSSDNKIAIGVNPRTSVPTPITAPTTYPVLSLPSALHLQTIVRYRDETASPSVKSKPYGVTQMYLYAGSSAVGTPITDVTLLPFVGARTKSPTTVTWQSADVGKIGYFAGRWATRSGIVGPWSTIVSLGII